MKGVLIMTCDEESKIISTIDKVFEDYSGVPFVIESDEMIVSWELAVVGDTMYARRYFVCNGNDDGNDDDHDDSDDDGYDDGFEYYELPYRSDDSGYEARMARQWLYELILDDCMMCYADDLYCGSSCKLLAFLTGESDEDDNGLSWLLDIFMKQRAEFLQDLFFQFGTWVESGFIIIDPQKYNDDQRDQDDDEVAANRKAHYVRRVIKRCKNNTLEVMYEDDSIERWTLVDACGKIWYRHDGFVYDDDDLPFYMDEYGCIDKENPDEMMALRDVIFAAYNSGTIAKEYKDGDPLGIVGIDPEELSDDWDDVDLDGGN